MKWVSPCIAALCMLGCAVNKPFVIESGWIKLDKPPSDAREILASSNEKNFLSVNDSWSYRLTWFQLGSDDYVTYFQYQATDDSCGDRTFEFRKVDGKWTQVDSGGGVICSQER